MRVYVKTFGCASNKAESGLIKRYLVKSGFELVDSIEEADAVVVNTCTVRKETDLKVIKYLASVKGRKVVVTGCMVAAQPALVSKHAPSFSIVSPNCPSMIPHALNEKGRVLLLKKENESEGIVPYIHGVKCTILISRGCLGGCSYCIVRVAKGSLKSIPLEVVKGCVIEAVKSGALEIRLSAQDTGIYGADIGTDLPSLLNALVSIPGDFRIRVGMFKPSSVLGLLNGLIQNYRSEKVYKFAHIPVQSGSGAILERMRRGYDVNTFRKVVGGLRAAVPNITIFTDVIVGFPGEGDFEFEETCELIREIRPDKTHIARFSPRPHTPAASMPQVPESEKKKRSDVLHKLSREIQKEKNSAWVGRSLEANVVDFYLKGGMVARTDEYKTVVLPGCDPSFLGRRVEVSIEGATPFYLIGRITRR